VISAGIGSGYLKKDAIMDLQSHAYLNEYHRQGCLAELGNKQLVQEVVQREQKLRPTFWVQIGRVVRHLDRLRRVRIVFELNEVQAGRGGL
jgi:hypothetical protein